MRYIISVIKSKILLLLLKENKPLCANCITKMIGEGESYFQRQKVSVNLTQLKDKGLVRKTGFLCEGKDCNSRAKAWTLTDVGKQWAQIIERRGLIK